MVEKETTSSARAMKKKGASRRRGRRNLPANDEQRPVSAVLKAPAGRSGASLAAVGATRRAAMDAVARVTATPGREAASANDILRKKH